MAELLVIRHAQASFGADNYDQLSELGYRQSEMAGAALRASGWVPDRLITGTLARQIETLKSMGFKEPPEQHAGLNEYDFHDLLSVRFKGKVPDPVRHDRKTHFRTLRETILDWQSGGIAGAKESWHAFSERVENARKFAIGTKARRILVISSGGPIGELVKTSLGAPDAQMMALNLQVKNTSFTRFFFNASTFLLHEFNATPHFSTMEQAKMLTFS
jgi:broad specificity phosphatase PhoE